jgi:hypothetical protein
MNPFAPASGLSDPHARVFKDRVYLYTGRDGDPDDRDWVMRDWRIFSSTDLIDWRAEGVISPANNYMGAGSTDCWAGDTAERDGRYYFYFSDRTRGIGVMVADSPAGPFRDPLGKPLVAPMHDPTILIDDDPDRTPWMLYGEKSHRYHLVRLNDDMTSLADNPQPIEIRGREWEAAPKWMDKNYLFKRDGVYFLSWGRDYAVSDRIEGPYQCRGSVGEGEGLSEYAHGSFFHWRGRDYHVWCRYLRPGYKFRELVIRPCKIEGGRITTLVDQPLNTEEHPGA